MALSIAQSLTVWTALILQAIRPCMSVRVWLCETRSHLVSKFKLFRHLEGADLSSEVTAHAGSRNNRLRLKRQNIDKYVHIHSPDFWQLIIGESLNAYIYVFWICT